MCLLIGEKSSSVEMKIIFTELLLFGRMEYAMKKEILRSRDILSRKIQRLLSCHFSPRTLGGSCQEKEDPRKSGRKYEHINGRNDRF